MLTARNSRRQIEKVAVARAYAVLAAARCKDSCKEFCEVSGEEWSQVGARHLGDRQRGNGSAAGRRPALSCSGDVLVTPADLAARAGDVLVTAGGEDRGESVV